MKSLLLLVPLVHAAQEPIPPLAEIHAELKALDKGLDYFYEELCALPPLSFAYAMRSEQGQAENVIDKIRARYGLSEDAVFAERAGVVYGFAEGYALYPNIHRQITGNFDFEAPVWRGDSDYLAPLDFENPALLDSPAFRKFLMTYCSMEGRERLRKDPKLRMGENCLTRARYAIAKEVSSNEVVRNHLLHAVMDLHFENHHVEGIAPLLDRFAKDCTDAEQVAAIVKKADELRAERKGHTIEVYREIDGLELEIHLWFPEEEEGGDGLPRPILVWFHGGGWQYGSWSWHMGTEALTARGFVVASVDYRVADRHWASPADGLSDARAALRWIREGSRSLGVDPDRVYAAGFSAGGAIAASTALITPCEPGAPSSVPNAVVMWSAPADPRNDAWLRESLFASGIEPADLSPALHVHSRAAPFLVLHGENDPICSFDDMERFVAEMRSARNRCELVSFPGGHFFQFESPDRHAEIIERIATFLD